MGRAGSGREEVYGSTVMQTSICEEVPHFKGVSGPMPVAGHGPRHPTSTSCRSSHAFRSS